MIKKQLPVIESIENINDEQLDELKSSGFCFVKIDEHLMPFLSTLVDNGIDFFHRPENEKQLYVMDKNYEGYLNHREKGNLNIERYAYKSGRLPEPLSNIENQIKSISLT